MSNICILTKKKSIIGNSRSHSMKSTKRKFMSNIHKKKFWIESKNKFIKLKVSTKAIKIFKKYGIENTLLKFNIKF